MSERSGPVPDAANDVAAATAAFAASRLSSKFPLNRNCVAFSKARAQISDAFSRTDDFCVVIGQAAERHRDRAGFGIAGEGGAWRAGRQSTGTAVGDAATVARFKRAADRRCAGALVCGAG